MWNRIISSPFLTGKTKIYFSDSPSENGHYLRTRVMGLIKHKLCYKSDLNLQISTLNRRFPIEQNTWNALTANAPEHCEQLLRERNSDLLFWIKSDKSEHRFKIKALTPHKTEETLSPHDILISELEPIPVDNLDYFTPILSLYALAQIRVPSPENKRALQAYAAKIKQLSPALDTAISSPVGNMPANFHHKLKRFQAWAWAIMGIAYEDTAKLGRAKRTYQSLIADWPEEKLDLEYGQTLSNLAALQFAEAHLLTGMEPFETCLDNIDDAQTVLSRTKYPILWAKLQELKSETQISLGERYCDTDHLETSIHTLQTVRRVWNAHEQQKNLAKTQFRIGEVLHKIGRAIPGTERLEQASTAFYGAMYAWNKLHDPQSEGKARLSLAQTLIDLGERAGSKERLEEAIKIAQVAHQYLQNRNDRISCKIIEAHALTRIGCQYSDKETSEDKLKKASELFSKILKHEKKIDIYDRLHSIEFLSMALGHLGKNTKTPAHILTSSELYKKALDIIATCNTLNLPEHVQGRLYGQLARNYGWLGRITSHPQYLDQTTMAYEKAIEHTDRESMSRDWAILQCELAENLISSSKHRNGEGADIVDRAVQSYHRSLSALQRKRAPLLWAQIKNKLAEALTLSGALGGGTPCLEMAIESYSKALEEWQPGPSSLERATALNNMANVLADLGRREADGTRLNEAQRAFSEAYDLYSSLGHTSFAERVHDNLSAIKNLLTNDFQIDAHKLFDNAPEKALILSHT